MASALRIYRLGTLLAAVSVVGLGTGTVMAFSSLDHPAPDLAAIVAACRAALSPFVDWPALAVGLLGALSLATSVSASRRPGSGARLPRQSVCTW